MNDWQILTIRYAENRNRTRRDSFVIASDPDAPHPMDFYVWVLRRGTNIIVVDTGMDRKEAARRGRDVTTDPVDRLRHLGIDPAGVKTVVLTHLHFDHAACLSAFSNANFHMQTAELAFATGPMMGNVTLSMPYNPEHVTEAVRLVHAGRMVVHDGEADTAPGVTGHLIGGHARGLMALAVETDRGLLILASDTAHYFESVIARPIFQIVVDPEAMVRGYDWLLRRTGGEMARLLPAHDPLLRQLYPALDDRSDVLELSAAPDLAALPDMR